MGAELPAGLAVITREGCTLCDAMFEALAELRQRMTLPPVVAVDVDGDPDLARRYGHKVPVLVCDGAVVCHYQLDEAELRRILARWAP